MTAPGPDPVLLGCGAVIAALRDDHEDVLTLFEGHDPKATAEIATAAIATMTTLLRQALDERALDRLITDLQAIAAEQAAA